MTTSVPSPIQLMGILNVTPDSFSDGGLYNKIDTACQHACQLVQDGAHIIDIGGESTRPSHTQVSELEELNRTIPLIHALREQINIPLSIDTTKANVAKAALEAGATIVNDVWGLQKDPNIADIVAEAGAKIVIMHNREQEDPSLDIIKDVMRFWEKSIQIAESAGIPKAHIILDPGCGFQKTHEQSMALIKALPEFCRLGYPLMIGASRKRFIGHFTGQINPQARDIGSVAAGLLSIHLGATYLRVHNVAAHREALNIWTNI